jgi:hypothetical protein
MTVLITSVPFTDTAEPIMAPALLQSILQLHGYNAVGIDLNAWVYNYIKQHAEKHKLLDFFYNQTICPTIIDELVFIIDHCTNEILKYQPTCVGLSLFSHYSQVFTKWLAASLKTAEPGIKIIIGGAGMHNHIAANRSFFCEDVIKLGIVDDYISGDADKSIIEYFKGNTSYYGINTVSWLQDNDMGLLPMPNYSNYNMDQYDNKCIPLLDSRGCVKNCEFCDIIEYWQKFNFRSAESIFNEILSQIATYNIRHIAFKNSLINGNLKEFKKLIVLIADYNRGLPREQQISWGSYFIVRQASQHPPEMWQLLKENNAKLYLGIESLIERVRHGMGKTFDNAALTYHLQQAQHFDIKLFLLIIVGYPTETLEDYEATKQWFRDNACYASTVYQVGLSLAAVLPNTTLARKAKEYNIVVGNIPTVWTNKNLNITPQQRINHQFELEQLCIELNYNSLNTDGASGFHLTHGKDRAAGSQRTKDITVENL